MQNCQKNSKMSQFNFAFNLALAGPLKILEGILKWAKQFVSKNFLSMRHEGFNKSKKRRQVKKNCVVYFEQGKNKFANF